MTEEQIAQHIQSLCEDIKDRYLVDIYRCSDYSKWPHVSQESMRSFVESRDGWKKDDEHDGVFIFSDKHHITISCLHEPAPAILMMRAATDIAKAELVDDLVQTKGISDEDAIEDIVKCVNDQDWIIPFVRKRINS